jgi:IS30 family transposase
MSYVHLSAIERGQIQALLEEGKSVTHIGRTLGRNPSTISRERRRSGRGRTYDAKKAHQRYQQRRVSCRPGRKLEHRVLWQYVIEKLRQYWSPQQVAGRVRLDYPEDLRMRISHETVYRALYSDERLRPFVACLRQHRPKRRKRGQGKTLRCCIPHRTSIRDRPPEVQKRVRFGDWEADLVLGKNQQGAVVSLVARKSMMLLARKVQSKQSEEVVAAVIHALEDLPASWARTVTFDNGSEFYHHQRITHELGVATYFADPYAAYQRGVNENTNGLLRQYLPKGTSFENLTQPQLQAIVEELNNRPRKTLDYRTPYEVFRASRPPAPVALSP